MARAAAKVDAAHPVIVHGVHCIGPAIYGLVDPLEADRIRYVGKTLVPAPRLARHIADATARGSAKDRWICELLLAGRCPDMVLLERLGYRAASRELWWFDALRERGQADLNSTVPKRGEDFPQSELRRARRAASA